MESAGNGTGKMGLEISAADIVLLVLGGGFAFWSYNIYEPLSAWRMFRASLLPGLALAGLFVFYLFRRRLKIPAGPYTFKNSGLGGGAGLILGVWGIFMFANGFADTSAAVNHEVRVVSKFAGNKSSYRLTLSAGAGSGTEYVRRPRRREFDLIEVGAPCTVSVKEGYWGFGWIAGIICSSGGRYIASGSAAGTPAREARSLAAGFFREIPAPAGLTP